MFPAILTTLLWSYCLIPARESVAQLGENAANVWRLLTAVVVMGLLAAFGGVTLGGSTVAWLFISGIIGFGVGDIGVWFALPRIGTRLTLLMVHCIAAPLAGVAEWLWLGTVISGLQVVSTGIILVGISLALFPEHERSHRAERRYGAGILFGLLAATGQGMGAVCSRKAFSALEANTFIQVSDYLLLGVTSGFIRLLGGILIAGSFWFLGRYYSPWRTAPEEHRQSDPPRQKIRNILLCSAAGPILGVICYQWALATTPSLVVQVMVSLSPLVILPMTCLLEGDRLTPRSIIGTLAAVGGVILLACG